MFIWQRMQELRNDACVPDLKRDYNYTLNQAQTLMSPSEDPVTKMLEAGLANIERTAAES